MKTYRLVASNPASALEKVHRQLGPSAVVLSMRQLPGQGLARLWHKSVEIVAGLPNAIPFSQPPPKSFPGTRRPARLLCPEPLLRWPTVAWLESMGLLSAHAEALQAQLNSLYPISPASRQAEWMSVAPPSQAFGRQKIEAQSRRQNLRPFPAPMSSSAPQAPAKPPCSANGSPWPCSRGTLRGILGYSSRRMYLFHPVIAGNDARQIDKMNCVIVRGFLGGPVDGHVEHFAMDGEKFRRVGVGAIDARDVAQRSSVSTARVSHLQSTVVLPEPGGPMKTWVRGTGGGFVDAIALRFFADQRPARAARTLIHSACREAGLMG